MVIATPVPRVDHKHGSTLTLDPSFFTFKCVCLSPSMSFILTLIHLLSIQLAPPSQSSPNDLTFFFLFDPDSALARTTFHKSFVFSFTACECVWTGCFPCSLCAFV